MIKYILIILLFLFLESCFKPLVMTENYQVKKEDLFFDSKGFEKRSGNKSARIEYQLDDSLHIVDSQWNTGVYSSDVTKVGSPYTVSKIYYPNLKLKSICLLFDGALIGNSYEYDENGTLSKQYNNDDGYLFSITDLISLFKTKYSIDLTNKKTDCRLDKANKGQKPAYGVTIYPSPEYSIYFKVDGITGQIIKELKIPQAVL